MLNLAKLLTIIGAVILIVHLFLLTKGKSGHFRTLRDVFPPKKHFTIFIPLGSYLLISSSTSLIIKSVIKK